VSDELSERVRRLEMIEAARGLLATYADVVDADDVDGLADVFAADAILTAPGRRFVGVHAITDFYRATLARDTSGRRHFVTNVHVADASAAAVMLRARFLHTAGTGDESILGWGRYEDQVSVVDGEPRITARDIVVEFRGPVGATWGTASEGGS
jgi:uncharacterized protein (TIGR02246 family)